jgi:hypothetical protein
MKGNKRETGYMVKEKKRGRGRVSVRTEYVG